MTAKTEGFVGARLREAREARGLTAAALAQAIGVSAAAVSQYEKVPGSSPRPEVMEAICRVLGLPPHYFVQQLRDSHQTPIFYRSLSSASKSARVRAEQRFTWVHEHVVTYLQQFVEFPPVNLPQLRIATDPLDLKMSDIEEFGRDIRDYFGLGASPISNMTWLLENAGAILVRTELHSEKLDSFSAWVDKRPYIVLNSESASAVRYNFDLAHELAHLLLHAHLNDAKVFDPVTHRALEEQAHRFAGALLLPAKGFARDVFAPTLGAFRALKPKWRTSVGVMIHRVSHLGMINDRDERWLWVQYGRKGWKRWEPLDDELEIQEPRLLRQAMILLLDERIQTRSDMLAQIPLGSQDIESLVGLDAGFLNRDELLPLRLRHQPLDLHHDDDKERILPFPTNRR